MSPDDRTRIALMSDGRAYPAMGTRHGRAGCVADPPPGDAALSLLVERATAASFIAESVVPGVEVHADSDVTWVVHPGSVWRNAAVMIRLSNADAASRLDTMIARYRRHGRGMGLWLSPDARPTDLPALLRARRFRCRKHFPAMVRLLSQPVERLAVPSALVVQQVRDVKSFETTPHPAIGPPTTQLRRQALGRLRALVATSASRIVPFVAYQDGRPVGASELFLGRRGSAALIGLSVLEPYRGRGIGTALVEHTCQAAASRGATTLSLIATSEGEQLYARRGFVEAARFGYWYRSFQRARGSQAH
jgi:GNAT superfamily N-acetyltransferase